MKLVKSVMATNQVDLQRDRIVDSALEDMLEQIRTRGIAHLINHDWHRQNGWTSDGELERDGEILKLVAHTQIPEYEDEVYYVKGKIQELRRKELDTASNRANSQLTSILGTFDKSLLILVSGCNSIAFKKQGIAHQMAPDVFALQDKHGLVPMVKLKFDLDTMTFAYKNIILFPHKNFRRSMSRLNNFNSDFLKYIHFLQHERHIDFSIQLDPDIISVPDGIGMPGEKDYWRGPKFSDDLRTIPLGVAIHKNSANTEDLHGLSRTEFFWYSRDGSHIFEAEEIRSVPNLNDESLSPLYGQRYIHSMVDENTGTITHLDGAVRIYNHFMIDRRINIDLSKAEKNTDYIKLWRLDHSISVNTWKTLIHYYYRDNETIAEYFGIIPSTDDQASSRIKSLSKFDQKKSKLKKTKKR